MLIPSKMTSLVEKYFYDKTVEVYSYEKTMSPEGGRLPKGEKSVKGFIACNIHFVRNEDIRKEYGLSTEARLMITCSIDNIEKVSKGDFISYFDVEYEVIEILPHDSHLKVVCS